MKGYKGSSSRDINGCFCPAQEKIITTETCAANRGSRIQCPPDCPLNPFGFVNHDSLSQLQERWFDKARRRVKDLARSLPRFPFTGSVARPLSELMEVQWVMSVLLGQGPLTGGCPMEQWAADELASLSNDERMMTRWRVNTRATVLEIQRPTETNVCIARDVFDPELGEFVVFHANLSRAPRFSRFLGWFTWFPHYVHPLGHMVELVPHLWFAWREEMLHELKDRRNADASLTCQKFLRENFFDTLRLLEALARSWEESRNTLDPRPHFSAVYRVSSTVDSVRTRFESNPACAPFMVLPEHPTYGTCHGEYRFRIHPSDAELDTYEKYIGSENDAAGERTVGMFSLYNEVLLFHTHCPHGFRLGRQLLDEQFPDLLKFSYEDILDVTGLLKHQPPTFGVDPLPMALMEAPPSTRGKKGRSIMPETPPKTPVLTADFDLQKFVAQHHEHTFADFANRPHFFLDQQTPLNAMRTVEGRQQVIELIKVTLYEVGVRNQEFRCDLNIDGVLRALGLEEFILPPKGGKAVI